MGRPPTIPAHHQGVVTHGPVEYQPARYARLRKILANVAVNVVANLLVAAMMSAAHLLF